jgi:hypothetical protein
LPVGVSGNTSISASAEIAIDVRIATSMGSPLAGNVAGAVFENKSRAGGCRDPAPYD